MAIFIYIVIAVVALTMIAMILAFIYLLASGFHMFGGNRVPGSLNPSDRAVD